MPLDAPPPRGSRFGSSLVLSRVHWVRPELVAEVRFLAWTEDNLLRQVVYEGLREDKPAAEVRREMPHMKSGGKTYRPRGHIITATPKHAAQHTGLPRSGRSMILL